MQPQSVPDRLARVEEKVSRIETSSVPSIRDEMHAGFGEFRAQFEEIRRQFEAVDRRFESLERRMEQGFEEARRHSLVLYEDLVTRIFTIGEALAPASGRPRRKR